MATLTTTYDNYDRAESSAAAEPWRINFDSHDHNQSNTEHDSLQRERTHVSKKSTHVPEWWKVRLFRGMVNDLRRRAPYYWSDWTDAWDYRVVPATVYMYFAK